MTNQNDVSIQFANWPESFITWSLSSAFLLVSDLGFDGDTTFSFDL